MKNKSTSNSFVKDPVEWVKRATPDKGPLNTLFEVQANDNQPLFCGTDGYRTHVVWGVTSGTTKEANPIHELITFNTQNALFWLKDMKVIGTFSIRDFLAMSMEQYVVLDDYVCVNAAYIRDALAGFEHEVTLRLHPMLYSKNPPSIVPIVLGEPGDKISIIMPLAPNQKLIDTAPHFPT